MKTIMVLGALAIVAMPLSASASDDPKPQVIKTSDLDLRSESGLDRLNDRLAATAARVCSVYAVSGTSLATTAERRCRREAVDRTSTRVATLVSRANRTAVAAAAGAASGVGGGVVD